MFYNIIGALVAFVIGALIACLNYFLSKQTLKKHYQSYSAITIVRQIVQVAYIVALYFIQPHTPCSLVSLLVFGALGITLPMFFFTAMLVKQTSKAQTDSSEKSESAVEEKSEEIQNDKKEEP